MKAAQIITAGILAASMLSMTACQGRTEGNSRTEPEPSSSSQTVPEESSSPQSESFVSSEPEKSEDTAPAVIRMSYTDSVPADTASCSEFIEDAFKDDEYLLKIVIETDRRVTDVQFLDISLTDAKDDVFFFTVNDVLYTQTELTPEKPLVVGTVFQGDSPTRGISYTDTNGESVCLCLSQSGLDGSLVYDSFEPVFG